MTSTLMPAVFRALTGTAAAEVAIVTGPCGCFRDTQNNLARRVGPAGARRACRHRRCPVTGEAEVRLLYDGMVRIVVTPTWAKPLPAAPGAGREAAIRRGWAGSPPCPSRLGREAAPCGPSVAPRSARSL